MDNMFTGAETYSINPQLEDAKTRLIGVLTTNLATAAPITRDDAQEKEMAIVNARFAHLQEVTYAIAVTWDWPAVTTRDVDEAPGDACALPSQTQPLSTFITSVVSNSQTDVSQTEDATTNQETITTTAEDVTTTSDPEITTSTAEEETTTTEEETSTTETETTTAEPEPTTTEVDEPTTTTEESETTAEPTEEPAPTVSVTPLVQGEIVCYNEDDFPGHADIDNGSQDKFSTRFSGMKFDNGQTLTTYLHNGMPPMDNTFEDKKGVKYYYSVEWLYGCVTEVEEQDFRWPLGWPKNDQITAYLLVRENYTKCKSLIFAKSPCRIEKND